MAAERTSLMSFSMLPLASRRNPRCSGGAMAASVDAKNLMRWGLPRSRTSKSSAVSPVIGAPWRSVTITEKLTRSTPTRIGCCADARAAAAASPTTTRTGRMRAARFTTASSGSGAGRSRPPMAPSEPVRPAGSEHLIPADAHHLRTAASIRVEALETVSPLDRHQRAERRRDFRGGPDPGVTLRGTAEAGIADVGRIEESVDAQEPSCRPRRRRPDDGAAVVANQRRRVPAQAIVEAAEVIAAETIEVVAGHPCRFDAADEARRGHEGARQRHAVALIVTLPRGVL